jgi:hypothetical protein
MTDAASFLLPTVLAAAAGALLSFGYQGTALFFALGAVIVSIATATSVIVRHMRTDAD